MATITETGVEKTLTIPAKKAVLSISAHYTAGGLAVRIRGGQKLIRTMVPDWETTERIRTTHGVRLLIPALDTGVLGYIPNAPTLGPWLLASLAVAKAEDGEEVLITLRHPHSLDSVRNAIREILETAKEAYESYLSVFTVSGTLTEGE